MQSEYCIGVIAVKDTNILQLFPFIIHNGVKYKLLDVSFKSLTTDVRRCAEFNFKPISYHYDEDNVYLGLFFQPQHSTILNRNILSKYRIIKQFFDINIPQAISVDDGQSMVAGTTKANTMPSVSELYAMLRDAHERNPVNEEVAPVMPSYFVPELRSYQLKGLRWMLNRERSIKYSPPEYVPVRCPRIPNKMFYYNYRTVELKDHDPGSLKIPTGGILADEMGLGKTVEMLALILTNRNLKRKRTSSSMTETVPVKKLGAKEILRCICIKSKRHNAIQCKNCLYFQHVSCVAKYSQKPIVNYICPECWKLEPLVDSSTTFIVSPTSIKMQWNEEIVKHIANDNVRVLIYNGIKNSGWISPNDLKNYDIVLTDYNIMKAEMYYPSSTQQERSSRSERRYTIPSSPLTMVKWWRVVLDEAQMVETPKNNCSKMVKSLAAVHRWAVTGTPIEKSIDNLFGLLYFLDYVPFSDPTIWKNLSVAFNQGDIEPLIDQCLKNVMWRTCKVNVWQEIGLLPQTEIIHRITMSDSEALYYKDQHSQCANAFLEKVHKLNKSLSMFKMNPKTLNKIMPPLLKLRQDCTVPTIRQRHKNAGNIAVKKALTPNELMAYMVKNNETDCKEKLRIIGTSLNGQAAIYIIRSEFDVAVKMYESVLRWAKDYTGKICVDSLLQVHALHNLIEITEPTNDANDQREEYKKDLERLEWKYLDNSVNLVRDAKDQLRKVQNEIIDRVNEADDNSFRWWAEYAVNASKNVKLEQQIMDRISAEMQNYSNPAIENMSTIHGVAYVVGIWLDRFDQERNQVQESFKQLEFFSNNIKPRSGLDPENLQKVDALVKAAFDCHLDNDEEHGKKRNSKKKEKRSLCLLCQVKKVLLKYECLIFDKTFVEDVEKENSGNWNRSFQEGMLRVLYSFAKRNLSDEIALKDGALHLQIIELMKEEYKQYSQFWVEVNHSAAAYDELKMCKSRIRVNDLEIEDEPTKSTLHISKYEVDEKLDEFRMEKELAERKFIRIQGILKYLKHLENNVEPDNCPICKEKPTKKYCVLQCGHHLCYECFYQAMTFYKVNYDCCICRHRQKFDDVHFVTCKRSIKTGDDTIEIQGDYSQKIEEIVRTILKLRNEDSEAKIIIFSHWETILKVIATALVENNVVFRMKSANFHKSIEEFKKDELKVTCLLLPLTSGSKGLNLIEATHVFLVEPILNPAEESQAIGRIHRIGQSKPTFVHRFIVLNTIEETIFNTISNDKTGKWKTKEVTVDNLKELFTLNKSD